MLLIVRHGETGPNVEGRLLGRADPPLTPRGHEQAHALAAALPRPTLIVTSPLRRARETAAAFGTAVQVDDNWIELDYGELDGRPASALAEEVGVRWRADVSFSPPGGESLEALGTRVREACENLADLAQSTVVVVVTHVSPTKAAIAWALDTSDSIAWRMFVEDAGVSRIDIEPTGPVLRWFNRGVTPID